MGREAPHLQPRMIDLEPGAGASLPELANEMLHPDRETHIAYRGGYRQAARLVRVGASTERLALPEDSEWTLEPDASGALDYLQVDASGSARVGG